MLQTDEILTRIDGSVGYVTLNRPKAINSLNQSMIDTLRDVLSAWRDDPAVETVVIDGRANADSAPAATWWPCAPAHSPTAPRRAGSFDEYTVNGLIGRFPKPYVAVMDGIVMGGGVGVSAHGSVRVVTDTTKLAMPEVGIGFIPDVGGTYVLAHAPAVSACTPPSPGRRCPGRTPSNSGSRITSCRTTPSMHSRRPSPPTAWMPPWPTHRRTAAQQTCCATALDRRMLRHRRRPDAASGAALEAAQP